MYGNLSIKQIVTIMFFRIFVRLNILANVTILVFSFTYNNISNSNIKNFNNDLEPNYYTKNKLLHRKDNNRLPRCTYSFNQFYNLT